MCLNACGAALALGLNPVAASAYDPSVPPMVTCVAPVGAAATHADGAGVTVDHVEPLGLLMSDAFGVGLSMALVEPIGIVTPGLSVLLTEAGDALATEAGSTIVAE